MRWPGSGHLLGRRRFDLPDDQVLAARSAHDVLDVHTHRVGVDHDDIAGARIAHDWD